MRSVAKVEAAGLAELAGLAEFECVENLLEAADCGCILREPSNPQEGKSNLKGDSHGKLSRSSLIYE